MVNLPDAYRRLPPVLQRVLLILDEYLNERLGGDAGDTLSERFAKSKARGEAEGIVACRILDRIEKGHCDRINGTTSL